MTKNNEARDYFYAHLHDVTDDCMIWPYATNARGYGVVWIGGRSGRSHLVHTLACAEHHGPRPEGMEAAHGPCHNPRCWNGAHLSWKTHAENMADMIRDGSSTRGERNTQAVLDEGQVREIRAAYARGGVTQEGLGQRYGVSRACIQTVVAGKRWAHV